MDPIRENVGVSPGTGLGKHWSNILKHIPYENLPWLYDKNKHGYYI